MKFTVETLYRTEPTGEVSGYRIWRDDGTCMETYDPFDEKIAEARCSELNRIFGSVTKDDCKAELAEYSGQG